ncbi:MAG: anti-phage deoxyguanosine triphosphatase [Calditrichia bacterium]
MPIKNEFYNDFDKETFTARKQDDHRSPFQMDRDRLIYSSAFRRLQSKTQVFLSGEYDFYRTRLTHTLEVGQVARSIVQFLRDTSKELNDHYFIDSDLVEAVSLAHDLGHPPFGHTGERALHEIMEHGYGGFEGNAQTLRIITDLIYSTNDGRKGMAPTRAFMDGIMKYKILFSEREPDKTKYLYDDQMEHIAFTQGVPQEEVPPVNKREKSIECQIMDWADNTAYSINDLLDGYKAGFISLKKLEKWAEDNKDDKLMDSQGNRIVKTLLDKMQQENEFERFMSRQIGKFITSVSLKTTNKRMAERSNRYRYDLVIDPYYEQSYKLYAKIAFDLIFEHPSIQQLEFKGEQMLKKIFHALAEEYLETKKPHVLLPPKLHQEIISTETKAEKFRKLCDHISGMTDAYAVRLYRRLFEADFGSINDIVE